jgi:hypothetical protein
MTSESENLQERVAALVRPGRPVLIGEVHGTNEVPAFIGDLIETLCVRGAVRLALEIPQEDAPLFRRFLDLRDEGALLRAPFFNTSWKDGRSSEALVRLLARIARLRANGAAIGLLLFDQASYSEQDLAHRDQRMAERVVAGLDDRELTVLVAGNVHTRVTAGVPWDAAFVPMGASIVAVHPVLSLDFRCGGGTAWIVRGSDERGAVCDMKGEDLGSAMSLTLYDAVGERGHHGELYYGRVSASPPAVR